MDTQLIQLTPRQIRELHRLGTLYTENGCHRVYFSIPLYMGLHVTYKPSGAIARASYRGAEIEPEQAIDIKAKYRDAKFYFDLTTGLFCGKNLDAADLQYLIGAIQKLITNLPKY